MTAALHDVHRAGDGARARAPQGPLPGDRQGGQHGRGEIGDLHRGRRRRHEDTTPPETAAKAEGSKNSDGDYIGSAKVTVTATDAESGVARPSTPSTAARTSRTPPRSSSTASAATPSPTGRPTRRATPRRPQKLSVHGGRGRRRARAQLPRVRRAADGDRRHGRHGRAQPHHPQPLHHQRADRGREGAGPRTRCSSSTSTRSPTSCSPTASSISASTRRSTEAAERVRHRQARPETSGYRDLFDGTQESFAKWQHVGGGAFGLNADGIDDQQHHGRRHGHAVVPAAQYGDFSLKLQWRDDAPGTGNANSGVFVRFPYVHDHPEESRPGVGRHQVRPRGADPRPARRRHVQDGLGLRLRPGRPGRCGGHARRAPGTTTRSGWSASTTRSTATAC